MVLGLGGDTLARWGVLDRLGWSALPAYGLLEERDEAAARAAGSHLASERVVLWDGPAQAPAPSAASAEAATRPDVELLERVAERALATRGGRAAVFVDRDGTLIVERGYLGDPAGVELLPGAVAGLRLLRDAGFPVVVISNQSGIARGKFTLAAAHATMARLRRLLREQGVELDSIRFCPHAPEEGCTCRKPGTRLLAEAAEDLRLSLPSSAMVGDKRLDAETGRAAGGTGVLVRTGYGREEEARNADGAFVPPDAVVDDFAAAAAWIVARHESR
jgi:histidinol-phosphate phosphatase family protein